MNPDVPTALVLAVVAVVALVVVGVILLAVLMTNQKKKIRVAGVLLLLFSLLGIPPTVGPCVFFLIMCYLYYTST